MLTEKEIIGTMKKFPAVWERVAGGLEVANENYDRERRNKVRGQRCWPNPAHAALALYLLLFALRNGEKISRRAVPD